MIEEFNQHRQLLFGIAYRMLGRVTEAEDMVQETWLRWQRQDPAEVKTPRAWLVSTLTRLCIDHLRSARHKREEYYGVWLPEPLVHSSARPPDEAAALADSLTMAFMLMLETLAPVERAVYLLREVFDYEYSEIAAIVGKSAANCRQIVSRARAQVARAGDAETGREPPPTEQARRAVEAFLAAANTGKVGDLVALLTADATLYTDGGGLVASAGRPILTADRISRFFVGIRRHGGAPVEYRFALINSRFGALQYVGGKLDRTLAFELSGARISAIYLVRNPEKLRHLDVRESVDS